MAMLMSFMGLSSAGILRGADPSADFAGKGIVAGVGLIVTFFKGLTFVFTIHGNILLKLVHDSFSGGMACGSARPPGQPTSPSANVVCFKKFSLYFFTVKFGFLGPMNVC